MVFDPDQLNCGTAAPVCAEMLIGVGKFRTRVALAHQWLRAHESAGRALIGGYDSLDLSIHWSLGSRR